MKARGLETKLIVVISFKWACVFRQWVYFILSFSLVHFTMFCVFSERERERERKDNKNGLCHVVTYH